MLSALGAFIATLRRIERGEAAGLASHPAGGGGGGRIAVNVFPAGLRDRLLQLGLRAEVWMQPGVTAGNLDANVAVWYRQGEPAPRVAAVLGAGNITSIGLLDVLYKLLAEGAVCVLKVHPLLDYLAFDIRGRAGTARPGRIRSFRVRRRRRWRLSLHASARGRDPRYRQRSHLFGHRG